jgi:hypothetical protein
VLHVSTAILEQYFILSPFWDNLNANYGKSSSKEPNLSKTSVLNTQLQVLKVFVKPSEGDVQEFFAFVRLHWTYKPII